MTKLEPIHPGEVLKDEFMEPMGLSGYALAKAMGVPQDRISKIIHGKRNITADTPIRLSEHFGNTAEFWMNLASSYEIRVQRELMRKRAG